VKIAATPDWKNFDLSWFGAARPGNVFELQWLSAQAGKSMRLQA